MRRILTAALVLFGCARLVLGAPPTNTASTVAASRLAPPDTLELLNGDTLRGSFLSFHEKDGVRWQNSNIKPLLTVEAGGVSKVILPATRGKRAARPNCMVRLANGDELSGNLVALDEQELTLDTWYAGPLALSRPGLAVLSLDLGHLHVIYEGPSGPEGWKIKGNPAGAPALGKTPSGWQFQDEAFYGSGAGSLGREVKLPPLSSIEFDMAWRGSLQLALLFYTDNLEGYGGNGYTLFFNQRNVNLQRQSRSGNNAGLGGLEVPALGRNQARFALRTDRENRTFALLVDDNLIKQWTDNADFKETGTGLQFCLQGGQQAVKVSNLRITEWDGRLNDSPSAANSPADDLVLLANNDKLSGTLQRVRDGKLQMATPFAKLELPLDRVNLIQFAAARVQTNAPSAHDVRAFFAGRGRLTMRLERWDDLQMAGSSAHFGKARFLPWAFSAIQFNLDKQKPGNDAFDPALNIPLPSPEGLIEN